MSVSVTHTLTLKSPALPRFHTLHSPNPKFSVCFRACRVVLPSHQASSGQRVFSFAQGGSNFVDDPRARRRPSPVSWDEEEEEDDGDGNDEEDRSLDLLVRFVENVFKKLSKRARKAVRSVLPVPISANLVGFSVNGILVLALLWVLKAFLEAPFGCVIELNLNLVAVFLALYLISMYHEKSNVVCTLGSVVFVSVLLIRGIWSGVSFLQESRNRKVDELDLEHHAWNRVQPVT